MNQQGQMTAAAQMKPAAPTRQPEWSRTHFMVAAVGPQPQMPETRAAQFVYNIQNSISLKDWGQQNASSSYRNELIGCIKAGISLQMAYWVRKATMTTFQKHDSLPSLKMMHGGDGNTNANGISPLLTIAG